MLHSLTEKYYLNQHGLKCFREILKAQSTQKTAHSTSIWKQVNKFSVSISASLLIQSIQ